MFACAVPLEPHPVSLGEFLLSSTRTQQLDDGTAIIDADALQKVVEERKKNASINGAPGTAAAEVVPPPTQHRPAARAEASSTGGGPPKNKMV